MLILLLITRPQMLRQNRANTSGRLPLQTTLNNIVCETWYSFFHTNNRLHAVVIISQNRFASVGSQKSEPAAMCRMSTLAHREKN